MFEVGHERIDIENRFFFALVKDMAEAEASQVPRDKLRRLTEAIVKYAEFHFLSEENLMIDIGYPEFQKHHDSHKRILDDLQKYVVDFESRDNGGHDLSGFLLSWLVEHAKNDDLQLSRYINQA